MLADGLTDGRRDCRLAASCSWASWRDGRAPPRPTHALPLPARSPPACPPCVCPAGASAGGGGRAPQVHAVCRQAHWRAHRAACVGGGVATGTGVGVGTGRTCWVPSGAAGPSRGARGSEPGSQGVRRCCAGQAQRQPPSAWAASNRGMLCPRPPALHSAAADGPFVMNSELEIRQAFDDCECGLCAAAGQQQGPTVRAMWERFQCRDGDTAVQQRSCRR